MDENMNKKAEENVEVKKEQQASTTKEPMYENKGGKKEVDKKKIAGILLIAIAIVLIVAYFIISVRSGKAPVSNNSGNKQNNGTVQNEGNKLASNYENVEWTKENLPRIDCATAMKPLSREIVKATLGITNDEEAESLFQCTTTNNAYPGLVNGDSDIIFLFGPSDEQIELAAASGIQYETTTIGNDAFVFVVNKNNPVDSISSEDLRKIYNGEITNWSELGGNDEEILAFQRNKNSGSQTLMEKFMGDIPLAEAPTDSKIGEMGTLILAVANNDSINSIGYSVFYYASEMVANPNLKFVKVDGVAPSAETIANGTYPIIEPVKAVIRNTEPEDSYARKLIQWCLTDEGQEVVEKGGYVKLS